MPTELADGLGVESLPRIRPASLPLAITISPGLPSPYKGFGRRCGSCIRIGFSAPLRVTERLRRSSTRDCRGRYCPVKKNFFFPQPTSTGRTQNCRPLLSYTPEIKRSHNEIKN